MTLMTLLIAAYAKALQRYFCIRKRCNSSSKSKDISTQHKIFSITDVHCEILSYLDVMSLHRCALVNRNWSQHVSNPSSLKVFDLTNYFYYRIPQRYPESTSFSSCSSMYNCFRWCCFTIVIPILQSFCSPGSLYTTSCASKSIGKNTELQQLLTPNDIKTLSKRQLKRFVKQSKYYNIQKYSSCTTLVLDIKQFKLPEITSGVLGPFKSGTYDTQHVEFSVPFEQRQLIMEWYLEQISLYFNRIDKIVIKCGRNIYHNRNTAQNKYILFAVCRNDTISSLLKWIIRKYQSKIHTFKCCYVPEYHCESLTQDIIKHVLMNKNPASARSSSITLKSNHAMGLKILNIKSDTMISTFSSVQPQLFIFEKSMAHSMGRLQELTISSLNLITAISFWEQIANICKYDKSFWNQLRIIKWETPMRQPCDDWHSKYLINENKLDHEIMPTIAANMVNLNQFDVDTTDYAVYLLLCHVIKAQCQHYSQYRQKISNHCDESRMALKSVCLRCSVTQSPKRMHVIHLRKLIKTHSLRFDLQNLGVDIFMIGNDVDIWQTLFTGDINDKSITKFAKMSSRGMCNLTEISLFTVSKHHQMLNDYNYNSCVRESETRSSWQTLQYAFPVPPLPFVPFRVLCNPDLYFTNLKVFIFDVFYELDVTTMLDYIEKIRNKVEIATNHCLFIKLRLDGSCFWSLNAQNDDDIRYAAILQKWYYNGLIDCCLQFKTIIQDPHSVLHRIINVHDHLYSTVEDFKENVHRRCVENGHCKPCSQVRNSDYDIDGVSVTTTQIVVVNSLYVFVN